MLSMMESSPVLVAVRIRPANAAERMNGSADAMVAASKTTVAAKCGGRNKSDEKKS